MQKVSTSRKLILGKNVEFQAARKSNVHEIFGFRLPENEDPTQKASCGIPRLAMSLDLGHLSFPDTPQKRAKR